MQRGKLVLIHIDVEVPENVIHEVVNLDAQHMVGLLLRPNLTRVHVLHMAKPIVHTPTES